MTTDIRDYIHGEDLQGILAGAWKLEQLPKQRWFMKAETFIRESCPDYLDTTDKSLPGPLLDRFVLANPYWIAG